MKKIVILFTSIFAVFITANAQLLQEDFNFTGALTANGWSAHSGAGTNALSTTTGLVFPEYVMKGAGDAVLVSNLGGEDANRALSDSVYTNGESVYTSLLVNVTDTSTNRVGDYFLNLGNRSTSTVFTSFACRLFAKIENGNVAFGISNLSTAGTMKYTPVTYAKNTTYLIMLKYTINTAGVDTVRMWVFTAGVPISEEAAGAPAVVADSSIQTGQDIIDAIALRQGSATNSVGIVIDGIRIAKTWGIKNLFDDPSTIKVKNTDATITMDGKLNEADWFGAPTLLFGKGAYLKKQGGEQTVTGEADVKASFDVNGVTYHIPNTDSSWTRVKFLRKGTDLYIGLESNDKSICKFDWEADGLFMKIKNSAGDDKEYKLYYQNIDTNAKTIKYEETILNSGSGAGFLTAGSTVNDTTNVDAGYTAELRVKLASLGYDATVSSVKLALNIFDPDGLQFDASLPWPYGMMPFDSARGSYYKSWWGSEWGGTYGTLRFTAPYDDPDSLLAKNVPGTMTVDGKLDEPEWSTASTLVFGPSDAPKSGTEKTVTGSFDVKASFDVNGVTYHLPYKDTSYTRIKFLRKAMDLFIGIQSPDKSICKFDWEGDGLFMKIKNSAGDDKEYKLYYQNIDTNAKTIKYEETILNSGSGAGFLTAGSTVNDTTNVDAGYTAELRIKLGSLGYASTVSSVQMLINIFDPDGFQYNASLPWPYGMMPFDSARGSYFKSWWGSEWGGTYRTVILEPTTGVGTESQLPTVFALEQNYPNPFNPATKIQYSIPTASHVTLKVYNMLGQEVATLINGEQKAGYYEAQFDARTLSTGVYIYRIKAGTFVETKKMMLLK